MKMKSVNSYETSVHIFQSTRRYVRNGWDFNRCFFMDSKETNTNEKDFVCKKSQCSVDKCRNHCALKPRIDFLFDAELRK